MNPASLSTAAAPAATPTARSFTANRFFPMLRLALRATQATGGRLAARAAARVFCTPVPTKLATRHIRPPRGVWMERLPFEGASLTLYRWSAPEGAPLVLLTHGWGGWGLQMAPLADALQAAGYAVVAVDQPGHGRSAGWQSTLPQFVRALEYLGHRLGPLAALVGHSMGGASALAALARGMSAHRLVVVAAPTDLVQVTREYAAVFGLHETTRAAMVRHLEAREAIVFEKLNAAHLAPRVPQPALVVHDAADTAVPLREGLRMAALLPQARLLVTEGLGHRRVLKDPSVAQAVVRFVAGQ
ncbi:MAG TPA: alpha/beta fold hydrolase [Burkholderiaceae bacterium]|nr:alpha/beta fold hydrolase [Burkholderiaceae bacterium]